MYLDNIQTLDDLTLSALEAVLDQHTLDPVPTDDYTAFTWSVSRQQMFARCKRQYYLNYYAPRRITARGNHPAIGAIWWLKKATSLPAWLGTVVHAVANEAVRAHRDGSALTVDILIERASKQYTSGLHASQRGNKFKGQWIILQEHIYPADDAAADWDSAKERLALLIEAFVASEAYQTILSLPPEDIIEIDEPFQSILFDETRIFAIPDVLVSSGAGCRIIDWKTGDVEREGIRMQAGVYALYAHLKYGIEEDAIEVSIVDLAGGGESVQPAGGVPSLQETIEFIRNSMADMLILQDNPNYNTVAIEQHPMTDDLTVCRGCNFRRACWRHNLEN